VANLSARYSERIARNSGAGSNGEQGRCKIIPTSTTSSRMQGSRRRRLPRQPKPRDVSVMPLLRSRLDGFELVNCLASCADLAVAAAGAKEETADSNKLDAGQNGRYQLVGDKMKGSGAARNAIEGSSARQDMDEDDDEEGTEFSIMQLKANSDESLVGAIWSDMCVRVYDVDNGLSDQARMTLKGHQDRVTDISFGDIPGDRNAVVTSSEDGTVALWDLRSQKVSNHWKSSENASVPFYCTDLGCGNQLVVAGTGPDERSNSTGESNIMFWDVRSQKLLGNYSESHFDGVSQVKFNPSKKTMLASAGMDGLICYFDIRKPNEDEALESVMNTKGAVQRIGYFGPAHECLFCLGYSETLSMYHLEKAATMAEFPMIREQLSDASLPADYLIDCCYLNGEVGTASQTLLLVSGDYSGKIGLGDVTLTGVSPICSVSDPMAHKKSVRSSIFLSFNLRTGIPRQFLSGSEDGILCEWSHRFGEKEHIGTRIRRTRRTRLKGM